MMDSLQRTDSLQAVYDATGRSIYCQLGGGFLASACCGNDNSYYELSEDKIWVRETLDPSFWSNEMSPQLSRLERVPLRECWKNEARDFTPWLAQEENISLLGAAIGMELEVKEQEASVGPFKADILCRNTDDEDELVLIENQLEVTDHSHLGQLLTYSAGLKAVTLVWIAEKFTEEHRAAMDWLNERTDEDFNLFGLEIELWRIGDGLPAPKFNLVVKPNDWTRRVREASKARSSVSPTEALKFDFWAAFGESLKAKGSRRKPPKPSPSSWITYGIGRGGIQLALSIHNRRIMAAVEINSWENPEWFTSLLERKTEIEAALGFEMQWDEKPGNKHSAISIENLMDMTDKNNWPEAIAWSLQKLDALDKVFRPLSKTLPSPD